MRIPCPYCGDRDSSEFVYRGDASLTRPDPADSEGFADYVYLRANPAGPIAEHWYHAQGCRQWIMVIRNSASHEIAGAVLAKDQRR